jgi:mRNA interferase MazF
LVIIPIIIQQSDLRGDVFWVNLDPTIGSEIKKTSPAVIISNDAQNRVGQRFIVAPLTSIIKKVYPFEVVIQMGTQKSKAMLDQIRTVDSRRLGSKMGTLTIEEIKDIDNSLKLVLSLG